MKAENLAKKLFEEKISMRISYLIRKQVNIVKYGCDGLFFLHPKLVDVFLTNSSWDAENVETGMKCHNKTWI